MLIMVISAFLLLSLLDRAARSSRKDSLVEEFRYSVFALRDRLRQRMIDGTIAGDVWFDIVDSSMTAAVGSAHRISILHLLAVHGTTSLAARKEIVSSINRALADRPTLRVIVDEFRKLVWTFVCARNPLICACLTDGTDRSANAEKKRKRTVLDAVYVSRDYSTVADYVRCAA
jgi:hypothetical protein